MDQACREQLQTDMARLAGGDRSAFTPVFEVAWPAVQSFCRRFLGNDSDGDDAAQNAMLKIFNRASQFDSERDALPWLITIAAFECRTLRKKRSRRGEVAIGKDSRSSGGNVAEIASARIAIEATMTEMSPDERDTLLAAAGFTSRADIPAATFRKRLARARLRFKNIWRSRYGSS